ncbi:MAG: hypothetical protein IAI49_14775 [Candidatus Eremiobacteraeota bacterium]|nr:hypothetical protein [Candidatus Eremiobacteraeota bacterium]
MAVGPEGSHLTAGQISARHMYGGNASDGGAMVDSSSNLLYARHSPMITSVINSSGMIPSSGSLVPQSSALPTVSNISITSTPTSSATSYGNYGSTPTPTYSKIVASWSASTVYFPSGGTLAIAAGTQTFYVAGLGGTDPTNHLQPSQSYYVNAWIVEASATLMLFYTPNSLTVNEAAAIFGDGLITVTVNNGPVTTPAAPGSGSSSGGTYTPPPPTCPAVGQIIQTKRGFVKAEEIVVGDELLDWDDGVFNRVDQVTLMTSEIFRVVAGTEEFRVDRDHQWVVYAGKTIWWWPTHSLSIGDALVAADGGKDIVTEIESLGEGEFVGIDCERHRFRMGRLIAHNVATGAGH